MRGPLLPGESAALIRAIPSPVTRPLTLPSPVTSPLTSATQEMNTTVFNLATGQEVGYSLPPKQAVLTAYHQLTRQNYNWWSYDSAPYPVPYIKTRLGHNCGDWAATD